MNPELPAVIVGCGPSAVPVAHQPDLYTLCAVNDAVRLCDRVDVLAVNDTPALRRVKDQVSKVVTLVVPQRLHDDPHPHTFTYYAEAIRQLGFITPSRSVYVLHTDPSGDAATFGRCRSTSDSLIAWLLSLGVRRLYTVGIEWDGRDGWAHGLPEGKSKTRKHRQQIWEHTRQRIISAGATVSRGLP